MALQELPKPILSRREREVAGLVAEGLTNREIAQRLFISERTADGHLEHIREKLGVTSRAQVAAWYVANPAASPALSPQLATQWTAPPTTVFRSGRLRIAIATALIGVLFLVGVVLLNRPQISAAPAGPIIATVAGSAGTNGITGGYTGDYGLATSAQLTFPVDIAVGPGDWLYIADNGNNAIRRVSPQGIITTLAGGGTAPFMEGGYGPKTAIGQVVSVAVAPNRLVYFSNGTLVASIGSDLSLQMISTSPIVAPWGLCFAPDGTLYIADTLGDEVWRRTPDGSLSVYAGSGTHGFGGDGGAATGAELSYPMQLALDAAGNLYIVDVGNDRIRRVDASTHVITTVAGSADTYGYGGDGGPADKALLGLPQGVAVAPDGDIYIADSINNRIRRVDAKTHVITTVAGTGSAGFSGDERSAIDAELNAPFAVAIDSAGDVLIVDTGNNRIRKFRATATG